MPRITIDNQSIEVPPDSTILDAAGLLGIDIPTLCYRDGCNPSTSCMVCVVKVHNENRLLPACATKVTDNMQVESDIPEIHQARRTALELLLSDHLGDCLAPCHNLCPAHMNIPLMIRQIAQGDYQAALATVKKDIPLPAVLGRICPAPCEKGCRREKFDSPLAICLLKRYVADIDLASAYPYMPPCSPMLNKRVAIVGSGPAGLSAAYYLIQQGYPCTLYDNHEKPGGSLQYVLSEDLLPRPILDAEINLIEKLGIQFQLQTKIGEKIILTDLQKDFDAVVIATGPFDPADKMLTSLETTGHGIKINKQTGETSRVGIFACGSVVRPRKLAVRSVADGKAAAASIIQFLSGKKVTGPRHPFTVRIGPLQNGEIDKFMSGINQTERTIPTIHNQPGFTPDQALTEAQRCLHCDCHKPNHCKLRDYADLYQARPHLYKGPRRLFEQNTEHPHIIYESGKCIACGICIQIAAQNGEKIGLSFSGRGVNVRVTAPFHSSLAEALSNQTAALCADACPTGALVLK